MEIQVEGLSPIQMELADRIWACDTQGEVDSFIQSLPTKRLRGQARIVQEMMIASVWDNVVKTQREFPEAREALDKFMN